MKTKKKYGYKEEWKVKVAKQCAGLMIRDPAGNVWAESGNIIRAST